MTDLINRYDLCVAIADASEKYLKEGKEDAYMALCGILRFVNLMPSAVNLDKYVRVLAETGDGTIIGFKDVLIRDLLDCR